MEEVMKRITAMVLTMAAVLAFASVAQAGTPRVNARQARQQARIANGVASGALTNAEAARLHAGQVHVQRVENRVKADGCVTAAERARLDNVQDRQSRKIWRKKHNARTS
jgi:hypothetical protein